MGYIICSRSALDKICEIYNFDRLPHGWSGQTWFLGLWRRKKRKKIAEHREYFLNMCPNLFSWAKNIKKWIQVKSRSASTCSLDDAFSEFMHVLGCLWCYFHRRMIHFVCNDDCRYFALLDLVFLLRLSWIVHTTLKGREVFLKTRLELAICPVISFKSRHSGLEWCWK